MRHLQKRFSNQLGFLPAAAIDWYLESRNILIGLENDHPAGYVLGRPSMRYDRRIRPITQAAVCMDAQRRGLGLLMLERVCMSASLQGQEIVQCWCAADIDAMSFWPAAGFSQICRRMPANARGRELVLWRRALGDVKPPEFWTPPSVAGWKGSRIKTQIERPTPTIDTA